MKLEEIRKKIKEKSSREARGSGNPNEGDIDRELSDRGSKRKSEDIPKQDYDSRFGHQPGNIGTGFQPTTTETGGHYMISSPVRPPINHDSGFSKFSKRDPGLADYLSLYKWTAIMDTASTLRPDLSDAVAAYSHFLNGEGEPKTFSYERYINTDNSGQITFRNAILDAQDAVIRLWKRNKEPKSFSFSGPSIPCGSTKAGHKYIQLAFPYPATENWQKTIGAHYIWLSGMVQVRKPSPPPTPPEFKMFFTLHAEDQYNFNPGMKDITTGIPDNENGNFVICGLAHGYRHTSTLMRSFSWKGFELGVASMSYSPSRTQRQPRRTR